MITLSRVAKRFSNGTQALADVFARNIAEHPADWHMLQPQWLADLYRERQDRLGVRRAEAERPGDQGQA